MKEIPLITYKSIHHLYDAENRHIDHTKLLHLLRPICAQWRRRMCQAKLTKEQTCCQGTMSPQSLRRSMSEKLENWKKSGLLNSLRPRPFWWAMAGRIAIGSLNDAAEPLVRFIALHKPMDVQLHCVIKKGFSWRGKKLVFHIPRLRRSTRSHISGNGVYDSNRVRYHP